MCKYYHRLYYLIVVVAAMHVTLVLETLAVVQGKVTRSRNLLILMSIACSTENDAIKLLLHVRRQPLRALPS
jgi:hypothetical protein